MSDIVVSNLKPRGLPNGAQLIGATLDWAIQQNYIFDFGFIGQGSAFNNPKTLFVDNSDNPSEIIVLVENTGQTFPIPGYQIGFYPLAIAESARIILSSNGGTGVRVNVQFYNYVVQPFTWAGPSAPASSNIAIGNNAVGNVPTAAPQYVAGIDNVGGEIRPFLFDVATGELLVKTTVSGVATEVTLAAMAADVGKGGIGTRTSVAGTVTSTTILAASSTRKGAMIYNDSTADLYLGFGTTAVSATSFSVLLGPGDLYEVPDKWRTIEIRGLWASATGNARITTAT